MPNEDFAPLSTANIHWQDGIPEAIDFSDPYFSRKNGSDESDYVFIAGNQLAQRFSALSAGAVFVIGETGFGTGLNFFRAAACFLQHAPAQARLHFISTEKHPLTQQDLKHALQQWPHLPLLRDELLQHWPAASPGFHQREFIQGRITLTLLYGDSLAMLRRLNLGHGRSVDAWFLDGFAPARNADMWQPELFQQLRLLSQPGTTLATFTAAGFVRRSLLDAGFAMRRERGYRYKRDMLVGLVADRPDAALEQTKTALPHPKVIIIGAGLAGATLARAFARRGMAVTVIEQEGIAAAASGNLAGVLYTTPSAFPTPQNRFYQSSYLHALHWLQREGFPRTDDDGALHGVLQYPKDARLTEKAVAALKSGLWPATELQPLPPSSPQLETIPGALHFIRAGYLSPPRWCRHLLDDPLITLLPARVERLNPPQQPQQQWQVFTDQGLLASADHVILANSFDAQRLTPIPELKLKKIRGQVSYVKATAASRQWRQAMCHAGYLTPALGDLHCVGATFDLHDAQTEARDEDDDANLAELHQHLPQQWQELGGEQAQVVSRRVGFRCQSTDFLPLAGAVPDTPAGLWLSIAHGSRGLSSTALCADLICAQILNLPAPVDQEVIDALAPQRFMLRSQQRLSGE